MRVLLHEILSENSNTMNKPNQYEVEPIKIEKIRLKLEKNLMKECEKFTSLLIAIKQINIEQCYCLYEYAIALSYVFIVIFLGTHIDCFVISFFFLNVCLFVVSDCFCCKFLFANYVFFFSFSHTNK